MRLNVLPVLAGLLIVSACTTVDPAAERAGVMASLTERTGPVADPVLPREGETVSEAMAVSLALANNHRLLARLNEAGLARADQVMASRPVNPIVEVVTLPGDGHGRIWDVDLRASLLGIAATPWRAAVAQDRYEVRQAETVLATLDFVAATRLAWVEAVAARQRLDLQQRIRDAAAASLVVAEEMRAAGNAPVLELERERIFAQQAELDYLDAEHAALQARLALARQLGVPVSADQLPTRLEAGEGPLAPLDAQTALSASLPLAAARSNVEAAAGEAGLENWASLLEHVELGGVFEREDGDWSRGWMLEFALPVFDTGSARRTAAQLRAEQAIHRHAALAYEIRNALESAQAVATLAQRRVTHIENDALPTSERLMDATMRQYNAMQVSVFDLMATVQMRSRTGQAYVDALADWHRARIALDQIRSGGSPAMVAVSEASDTAPSRGEGDH
ncbi:TolC family protein [uncultured Maricaulis sp.]|uniref:TolC family protein n=1 Tax=uncultured Maricaulis sp. TaxID=174710 RepID=UPI0026260F4E|nr:TolC family protein [uncultured Maricaulis sp.]